MRAAQLQDGFQIQRMAEEVHGQDGPGARRDALLDAARLEVVRLGIHVAEDRARPVNRMGLAEAMHESGVVMTSSPGPTPSAASTTWSAVVPEVVATAWPVPQSWAKAASSSRTLAPG